MRRPQRAQRAVAHRADDRLHEQPGHRPREPEQRQASPRRRRGSCRSGSCCSAAARSCTGCRRSRRSCSRSARTRGAVVQGRRPEGSGCRSARGGSEWTWGRSPAKIAADGSVARALRRGPCARLAFPAHLVRGSMTELASLHTRAVALLRALSGPHGIHASLRRRRQLPRGLHARRRDGRHRRAAAADAPVTAGLVRTLESLRDLQGAEGQIAVELRACATTARRT